MLRTVGVARRRESKGKGASGTGIAETGDLDHLFCGVRHARFHDPAVVYHVLVRTVQGRFLLRPDKRGRLAVLIAGVIGRAQELFGSIHVFADAWLSNHAHLLIQGAPEELPLFVGFVEREISRRWGSAIGWEGSMFQTYQSTALPTAESQRRAFGYVLSQSAKEHLVDSPLRWPGAHCARDLLQGLERQGTWFDGTSYGKALYNRLARKSHPAPPPRRAYERSTVLRFSKLPVLAHLSDADYRAHVLELVREIEKDTASSRRRSGRSVLGRAHVLQLPREKRSPLPRPPWFEKRRRMIFWAARNAHATLEYLRNYWSFQRAFREAARHFLAGDLTAPFPPGAFRPHSFVAAAPT